MARPRRWRRAPRRVPRPDDLVEALGELARCPCDAHRAAFVALFVDSDELLFLVAGSDTPIEGSGPKRVSPDERIALQTVIAGGDRFLLAFPDEASAIRNDPAAPYAALGTRQAADRVLEDPGLDGILVTLGGARGAWATLTRGHLRELLTADRNRPLPPN